MNVAQPEPRLHRLHLVVRRGGRNYPLLIFVPDLASEDDQIDILRPFKEHLDIVEIHRPEMMNWPILQKRVDVLNKRRSRRRAPTV